MKRISSELARAMISAYCGKPGNEAGGSLHIVLDDGNVEYKDVCFCLNRAKEKGDEDGIVLASELLRFSEDDLADLINSRGF